MLNPYTTLGVKPGADIKDVKKAYRKLANKHHPDKGGNEEKFKEIKEAYELIKLGKEKSKANNLFNEDNYTEYKGYDPDTSGSFHFEFHDANDFSRQHHSRHRRANRFVNVQAQISIHNAVCGGKRSMSIQTQGQQEPTIVEIDIPRGVVNHETIRYPGLLGNGTVDLNVTFIVQEDLIWTINGIDLTRKEEFTIWELINGTTREIPTIADGKVRLKVPPLTQPNTKMKLKSLGAVSRQNILHKGDMYVEIIAKIPNDIPPEVLFVIKDL